MSLQDVKNYLANATTKLGKVDSEIGQLNKEVNTANDKLAVAYAELNQTKQALTTACKAYTEAHDEISLLKERNEQLEGLLTKAESKAKELFELADQCNNENAFAQVEVEKLKAQRYELINSKDQLIEELNKAGESLAKADAEKTQLNDSLYDVNCEANLLRSTNEELQSTLTKVVAERNFLRKSLLEHNQLVTSLEVQVSQLEEEKGELRREFDRTANTATNWEKKANRGLFSRLLSF